MFRGEINQHHLVYLTSRFRKGRVGSLNSDTLKFSASICSYCNGTRTQANDRAWQHLSSFLQTECHPLSEGDPITT